MGLNNLDDSEEGIAKYLARNPNTCFVAEKDVAEKDSSEKSVAEKNGAEKNVTKKDGNIIGVILSGHDGRRGYIHHAAVAENEQRGGVGTALLDAAMSALEREGINKAALVAFKDNEKGNAFWNKCGFTERSDLVYRNKEITELTRIDT